MQNILCFNCGKSVSNAAFFCPFCLTQIKCKSCNSTLFKDAIGCSECGEPLKENNKVQNIPLNQIEFEQKGESKKFKASFTNEVGHKLVETFGATVVGGNIHLKKNSNPFLENKIKNNSPEVTSRVEINAETIEFEEELIGEELSKIFRQENEELILINPRLKQTTKLDNAIRIAILALYGYEKIGRKEIERKSLSAILRASKLNIPNFSTWINKCDEIIKNGTKCQLSVPGKEVAIEILKEIADTGIVKGNVKFSKVTGAKNRKKNNPSQGEDAKSESHSNETISLPNNQNYTINTSLDLNPIGKQSLKDFFTPLKSKNHSEHILVIVYYLEKLTNENMININSLYTAYKHLALKVPNFVKTFANIKKRNGYIDTTNYNNLKVTRIGENYLEHGLKKRIIETNGN